MAAVLIIISPRYSIARLFSNRNRALRSSLASPVSSNGARPCKRP